ncbi:hypothetical protein KZY47_003305 [Vibrio vulnificus]|nr:hypothetical protein [Vibrio vulnificus]MCU8504114.1 hypothetical protein [Vibrio vulnificus]
MNKSEAKKRMMFVQNDDYNFLSYITILTLQYFSCTKKKQTFVDYRKIAFIANIIFYKNKDDWNQIYYSSQTTLKSLFSIIQLLEKKRILNLESNEKMKTIDLWLNKDSIGDTFSEGNLFKYELDEIKKIHSEISRTRTLKLKTFLDRVFEQHGVMVWED